MAKLKVYVTPIGFHDAYVAAKSQKAALEAWGSDSNLFARGIASVVTDAMLAEEPLAKPGAVIKRLRGTAAEQIAALPKDVKRKAKPQPAKEAAPKRKPAPPPPDRSALDAAEASLRHAEQRLRDDEARIRGQIDALEARLKRVREEGSAEVARLEKRRREAEAAYEKAVRASRA